MLKCPIDLWVASESGDYSLWLHSCQQTIKLPLIVHTCVCQEKEQQWRTHVAKLTSIQEKTLQDRLARLRRFRVSMTQREI